MFAVINSVTRISLIETLYKFRTSVDLPCTYACIFSVNINSDVLCILSRFLAFHIPLVFAL